MPLALLPWIVPLRWDDPPDSTPWIWNIAASTRDKVIMAVGNGLASCFADVDPNVEAFNQIVFLDDLIAHLSDQPLDGECLRFGEIKEGRSVPHWKNESMQRSHRKPIPYGEGQVILSNNARRMDGAEHAGPVSGSMVRTHRYRKNLARPSHSEEEPSCQFSFNFEGNVRVHPL